MRWCCFLLYPCLILSSKVHTERCKRGLLSVSWWNQSDGFRRHCSRFTTQLLASLPLLPLPLLLFPTVESHTTVACPSMILIASGTVATSVGDEFWWLVMEMKERSSHHLQSNGRNPFLAPHKGICLVSHPEQVVTVSLAVFGMQREDSICAQIDVCYTKAVVTILPEIQCILFAMTFFCPENSRIKLLALMSVRRKANCGSTLVEVILGYQLKIPSKHPHFTPTCDSCDCGFPVHGLLLVLVYPWQLDLSLCLTLCLCISLSPLLSFLHLTFCDWQIDQFPHLLHLSTSLTSPWDCVCFVFSSAENALKCIVEISSLKL